MENLVIYHGTCKDGFCAAWVARNALKGQRCQFAATQYNDPPPDVTGKRVFILDFSYKRDVLLRMMPLTEEEEKAAALIGKLEEAKGGRAAQLILLDHHKTAEAELKDLPENPKAVVVFDMARSGAGLAWDFFHPGMKRPFLVTYVEDRDLWLWRKPESREINAYIASLSYDFEAWDRAHYFGTMAAANHGRVVQNYIDSYIDATLLATQHLSLFGFENVPVINAPYTSISEILEELMKREASPIAVGWSVGKDGACRYSLRSTGDLDVSEIAKKHGGGGHKNAAGFHTFLTPLSLVTLEEQKPKDVVIEAPPMTGTGTGPA